MARRYSLTQKLPVNLRYTQIIPKDPEPKAIACYGLAVHWYEEMVKHEEVWLRFVEGNPCGNLTIQYLEWLLEKTQHAGKKALVMIWDNAT